MMVPQGPLYLILVPDLKESTGAEFRVYRASIIRLL